MDRFIAKLGDRLCGIIKSLKSNMDRFIAQKADI